MASGKWAWSVSEGDVVAWAEKHQHLHGTVVEGCSRNWRRMDHRQRLRGTTDGDDAGPSSRIPDWPRVRGAVIAVSDPSRGNRSMTTRGRSTPPQEKHHEKETNPSESL